MALILCIESSGKNCSVALAHGGSMIGLREQLSENFTHAEQLHVFVEDVLKEANVLPSELHAIAVSEGPGSYTGLRIGVSAAKGLAFALNLPCIAIDTLKAMADFVRNTHPEFQKYMPMLDARRMEVYTAEYTAQGEEEKATHALIVDEAWAAQLPEGVLLFGDGAAKCLSLGNNFEVLRDVYPSAKMMIADAELKFGNAEFVDLAYFEPFYLKEFVPGVSTKSML